jgi:hypothetical protein
MTVSSEGRFQVRVDMAEISRRAAGLLHLPLGSVRLHPFATVGAGATILALLLWFPARAGAHWADSESQQSNGQPISIQVDREATAETASIVVLSNVPGTIMGFHVLLTYGPSNAVGGSARDFQINPTYFAQTSLGAYPLNTVLTGGPGRIHIVGLAPAEAQGAVEIGRLPLHISPDAPVGASQTITLTGQVNLAGTGVVDIEPMVATVQVVQPQERLHLPLIMN